MDDDLYFESNIFDCIQLQNKLIEVVEELRFRRKLDVENDAKMKILLEEKYNAQNQLAESIKDKNNMKESLEQSIVGLKKEYEGRLVQLHEEKAKAACVIKNLTQEVRILKDEAKGLHLNKIEHEQKVRELENRLHLYSNVQDTANEQLNRLQQQQDAVMSHCKKLNEAHMSLHNSVQQALLKQSKVEHTKLHQQKLSNALEVENHLLKDEIVALRSQLARESHKDNFDVRGIELVRLQTKIQKQDEDIVNQQGLIKKLREENNKNLSSLTESSGLLSHYTNGIKSLETEKRDLISKLNETHSKAQDLENNLVKTCSDLDLCRKRCQDLEMGQTIKDVTTHDASLQVDLNGVAVYEDELAKDVAVIDIKQESLTPEPSAGPSGEIPEIVDTIFISSQSQCSPAVEDVFSDTEDPKCENNVVSINLSSDVTEAAVVVDTIGEIPVITGTHSIAIRSPVELKIQSSNSKDLVLEDENAISK